jgi:hypothetical protein
MRGNGYCDKEYRETCMLNDSKIVAFVITADSTRARAFYEGLLGLRFVSDDQYALVMEANGNLL